MNRGQTAAARVLDTIPTEMLATRSAFDLPAMQPRREPPEPETPAAADPLQTDAFPHRSAEHLILTVARVFGRVIRMAFSLSDEHRATLVAEVMALEHNRLNPMQAHIERQRSFLSDASAKAAKSRRRRKRRVKGRLDDVLDWKPAPTTRDFIGGRR